MEGNLRLQIDWASVIVGSKFTVFVLLIITLYLRAVFLVHYIWRGNLTEGFLHHRFGGLIFGGAYFWNFTVYVNP